MVKKKTDIKIKSDLVKLNKKSSKVITIGKIKNIHVLK